MNRRISIILISKLYRIRYLIQKLRYLWQSNLIIKFNIISSTQNVLYLHHSLPIKPNNFFKLPLIHHRYNPFILLQISSNLFNLFYKLIYRLFLLFNHLFILYPILNNFIIGQIFLKLYDQRDLLEILFNMIE